MHNRLPFLARFGEQRQKDRPLHGEYSEQDDVHVMLIKGQKLPLILAARNLPELKTITEATRERED